MIKSIVKCKLYKLNFSIKKIKWLDLTWPSKKKLVDHMAVWAMAHDKTSYRVVEVWSGTFLTDCVLICWMVLLLLFHFCEDLGLSNRVHRQHQRYNFNYYFFFFAYRDATCTWVNTQNIYRQIAIVLQVCNYQI